MNTTQLPHSRHLLKRLENEWTHLCVQHATLPLRCRKWDLPGGTAQSLGEVLDRTGYRPLPGHAPTEAAPRAISDEAVDAALIQLLTAAKTDPLAGRVVLQRMLPGLASVARRKSYSVAQRIDALDDLVANSWAIIAKYPVQRRPRKVLVNLLMDTSYETFVRPQRLKRSTEVPQSHDMFQDRSTAQARSEPLSEFVELLTEARAAGVAQNDIDFLCKLVNHGRVESLAIELNVTARTVRNYREAVLHRVRQAVA